MHMQTKMQMLRMTQSLALTRNDTSENQDEEGDPAFMEAVKQICAESESEIQELLKEREELKLREILKRAQRS